MAINPRIHSLPNPSEEIKLNPVFIVGCLIFSIFKLWLIANNEIIARYAPHDASWFVHAANTIIQGNWLGDFDDMTLLRQPGYPIWIALVHLFGIPLRLGTESLLIFSAFVFSASAIKARLPNFLGLAWFILIIFHPLSFGFNNETECETFYTPMLLLSLGGFILIFLSRRLSQTVLFSFLTGMALAFLWNTREENLLIFGYFLLAIVLMYYLLPKSEGTKKSNRKKLFVATLIPFLCILSSVLGIRTLNYLKYGTFVTSRQNNQKFLNGVGNFFDKAPAKGIWEKLLSKEMLYVVKQFAEVSTGYPFEWATQNYREISDNVTNRRVRLSSFPTNFFKKLITVSGWVYSPNDPIIKALIRDEKGQTFSVTKDFIDRPDLVKVFELKPNPKTSLPMGYLLRADLEGHDPQTMYLDLVSKSKKTFSTHLDAKIVSAEGVTYTIDGINSVDNDIGPAYSIQRAITKMWPYIIALLTITGFMSLILVISFSRSFPWNRTLLFIFSLMLYLILSRAALVEFLHLTVLYGPMVRYLYPVMALYACLMVLFVYRGVTLMRNYLIQKSAEPKFSQKLNQSFK